ncbi:MAG: hypothetical protein OSJ62_04035 [Lachnospiraceae bacterium]|nr:hypothetical protein [Lachnospiraceae bacterium]
MGQSFRLVPKMEQNLLRIFLVYSGGKNEEIARVVMPHDNQMNDNVNCAEEICTAIRKRIKRSV